MQRRRVHRHVYVNFCPAGSIQHSIDAVASKGERKRDSASRGARDQNNKSTSTVDTHLYCFTADRWRRERKLFLGRRGRYAMHARTARVVEARNLARTSGNMPVSSLHPTTCPSRKPALKTLRIWPGVFSRKSICSAGIRVTRTCGHTATPGCTRKAEVEG